MIRPPVATGMQALRRLRLGFAFDLHTRDGAVDPDMTLRRRDVVARAGLP